MSETGWLGVEPRHLTALVAIHDDGSFRGAAARLGIAQSSLSQRIAQLEKLVGVSLVERWRGHTGCRLTDAGMTLVAHAAQIVAELDAALADVRSLTQGATLRVGAYESVSSVFVPGALAQLARDAPHVHLRLDEDTNWEQFFPRVASGELDAAFADMPLHPGPFTFVELMVDPCVLMVRADSPLARRAEPPTLFEVGSLPLIAGSWPMLGLIEDHLRAGGVEPRFVFRSETNAGVQALVAHGLGVAVMPRLAVNTADPQIAIVCLDELPARRIAFYWHRDRRQDDAIMAFLAALQATCTSQSAQRSRAMTRALPSAA